MSNKNLLEERLTSLIRDKIVKVFPSSGELRNGVIIMTYSTTLLEGLIYKQVLHVANSECDQGFEGLCLEWDGSEKQSHRDQEDEKTGEQKESREERKGGKDRAGESERPEEKQPCQGRARATN